MPVYTEDKTQNAGVTERDRQDRQHPWRGGMGDVSGRDPSSEGLDQTGAAGCVGSVVSPPHRHMEQFCGHHHGNGSLATTSNGSPAPCSDAAWLEGKVFYQGPGSVAQPWAGRLVCRAGEMGQEEGPVSQSMGNDGCARGTSYSWPEPPPPPTPTRSDSLLAIRQREGFACCHPHGGSDLSPRSPAKSKTPERSLRNGPQSTERPSLPLDRLLLAPSSFHAPGSDPAWRGAGFAPERHHPAVGDAGNVTPARADELPQNERAVPTPSLSAAHHNHGVEFDGADSRARIQSIPGACVSRRRPQPPSGFGQTTATRLRAASSTHSEDWGPARGSVHGPCPGVTASRQDPDPGHKVGVGCGGRQRSLSETSARYLPHQPPGLVNDPCSCCGPNPYPCKTHLTMTESVLQCSQRQIKNRVGGVGRLAVACPEGRHDHRVLVETFFKPANESSTIGAITAERTPMLHRLAFEATQAVNGPPTGAQEKWDLSGSPPRARQGQGGGDQGSRRSPGSKVTQLRKCKSTSQLILDEHAEPDRLTLESPNTSGWSAHSSKAAYRDQVKHAQCKVLEETSFKRRDLQLSWPSRAKLKPAWATSVRQFPMDSWSAEPRHTPTPPPPPVLLEDQRVNPTDPHQQPTRARSRKRPTFLQKNMCYSEPGRLHQLGRGISPRRRERAETFTFPDTQVNSRSTVSSRRRLFEEVDASQVRLKQMQHEALLQYFGRRWPRPCTSKLDGDPSELPQPAMHRRLLASSDGHYSSNSPLNTSQHTSAGNPWDHSWELSDQCLSRSWELRRSPKWTQVFGVSFTDQLSDQADVCRFGRRARSRSSPLPQQLQNEPACVDSDSLGELNISSSPTRPSAAKHEASLEVDGDWKYRNHRAVSMAVGKSRYERPRGMSLDVPASSFGKWASRMCRSTDHLHCPVSGGQPTGQDDVALVPPPQEMLSPERNWVKLRREMKWQASQGDAAFERSRGICKSRPTSSSEEPLDLTSPSPRSPMERARARACSLSSQPAQGHEVLLERSSAVSGDCGTDHGSASENIPVHSKPSPLHPEDIFPSSPSLEKTANYETGATEWPMSGNNFLSTVDFVPMKPTGYDTEDDIKDRLVDLPSSPVCSDSTVEMTLPGSMAKSEIQSGNTNPLPIKDHHGNRHETSRQLPTDRTNSCVHPRLRTKSPEELRTEKLIKEIIDEDRSLAEILDPNPATKTIMDLVEGMFQEDTLVLEACQRRGQLYSQTMEAETKRTNPKEIQLPSLLGSDTRYKAAAATMTLMQDINRERGDWPTDVTDKKKELIVTIRWRLQKLHEDQAGLQEDMKVNDSLGDDIEACVGQVCKPNEMQKYKTFIEDLDKVMGLLLCLSSRLVRVKSALNKVNESTGVEEKRSLNERHQALSHRHEGARGLKVHQDHRERMTFRILSNYLNEIQLQHCHHFVQMRKALIIRQKEIEENLRLTEEQLGFLENSL